VLLRARSSPDRPSGQTNALDSACPGTGVKARPLITVPPLSSVALSPTPARPREIGPAITVPGPPSATRRLSNVLDTPSEPRPQLASMTNGTVIGFCLASLLGSCRNDSPWVAAARARPGVTGVPRPGGRLDA
jgi:hypothetical protein